MRARQRPRPRLGRGEIMRLSGLFGEPDEDAEDAHRALGGEDDIGLGEHPGIESAAGLPAKLDIAGDEGALEINRRIDQGRYEELVQAVLAGK